MFWSLISVEQCSICGIRWVKRLCRTFPHHPSSIRSSSSINHQPVVGHCASSAAHTQNKRVNTRPRRGQEDHFLLSPIFPHCFDDQSPPFVRLMCAVLFLAVCNVCGNSHYTGNCPEMRQGTYVSQYAHFWNKIVNWNFIQWWNTPNCCESLQGIVVVVVALLRRGVYLWVGLEIKFFITDSINY